MIDRDRPSPSTCLKWSRSRGIVRSIEVRDLFERFVPEARANQAGVTWWIVWRSCAVATPAWSFDLHGARCPVQELPQGGDVGENVGPDLTKIGDQVNKAALLGEILDPSKTIDPQSATYLLETKDGRVMKRPGGRANQGCAWCLRTPRARRSRSASAEIDRLVSAVALADARAVARPSDGAAGGGFVGVPGVVTVR